MEFLDSLIFTFNDKNIYIKDLLKDFLVPLGIIYIIMLFFQYLLISVIIRSNFIKNKDKFKLAIKLFFIIMNIILFVVILNNFLILDLYIYIEYLYKFFAISIYNSNNIHINISSIFIMGPLLYCSFYFANKIKIKLKNIFRENKPAHTLINLAYYISAFIFLLISINIVGIDFSSIFVLIGSLGFGIGLGMQSLSANLFSGIIIIVSKIIKEHDQIEHAGIIGVVTEIKLLYTVITSITGENLIIPNSKIINDSIINYSYDGKPIIIEVLVDVEYSEDWNRVEPILLDVGLRCPYRSNDLEVEALIKSFAASGITCSVRIYMSDIRERFIAHTWISKEIWKLFRENSITVPFPQRDINLKIKDIDNLVSKVNTTLKVDHIKVGE